MGPRDLTRREPPSGATHFFIPAGRTEPIWFMSRWISGGQQWWLWTDRDWQWVVYREVPAKVIPLPEDCEHALPKGESSGRAEIPMRYMAGAEKRYPTVTLWLKSLERGVTAGGKPS